MRKGNFWPPTESKPLNRSQKICHRWLRRRPLQLCQIWWTSVYGGLLGEWVKYNWIFIYLFIYTPFFGNSPAGQMCRHIFAHDGSNDADSRKNVPFWGFVDIAPQLGGKIPKNSNFEGVNRRFQAKLVKSKNMHIIKTTSSIPTKFCTAIKTNSALRGWSEHTTNPRAAAAILKNRKKSPYLGDGCSYIALKFGTLTQFDSLDNSVSKIGPQ